MRTEPRGRGELVGRELELAALLQAVEPEGSGLRAVALVGEPGAGKSRLLEELAAAAGAEIVRGEALDSADGGGPHRLLRALLPDPGAVLEEETAFEAVAERLAARALRSPVALLLDDVQWAPPTGWRALAYLTRSLEETAVTVVLSGRPEFLEPGAAGARLVDELNRRRRLLVLRLTPLRADEIRRLARALSSTRLTPSAESRLIALSGGNPFFVEELVRAGAGDLTETPPTLRLAIAHRLERLPPAVRSLLEAGSVLGRTFSTDALATMTGTAGAEVEAGLEDALRGEFLERSPEGWAFRHDSVRETAYGLAPGRSGLHLRAALALAGADAGEDVARTAAVASHFKLGGAPAEAGAWSLRAARQAMAGRAPLEAMAHARAAVELLAADAARATEARLLQGEAAIAAGELDAAEPPLQALATAGGEGTAQALLLLGRLSRRREVADVAAQRLEAAIAAAGGGAIAAEAMIELATLNGLTRGRFVEAEANAGSAIAIAASLGDARLEARGLLALASSRARQSGPQGQGDLLRQALARAEAAGDPVTATEAAASLANVHYWVGEIGASTVYARRRLALAKEAGDVFSLRHTHSWLALLAVSRGDWAEAESLLEAARPGLVRLRSPEPIAFLEVVEGLMWLRRGDAGRAYQVLARAISRLAGADPASQIWYAGLPALAAVEDGRPGEATVWIDTQEDRLAGLPAESLPARSARNVLALVYARIGDQRRGAACEAGLRPHATDFHWWPAHRSLAALAELRGDARAALADLARAEALCHREGLAPDLASIAEARSRLDSRMPAANPGGLSRRELEVLALVAAGLTNKDIAQRLTLSERTVVNHVTHILNKLGTDNRAGAAAAALRLGILE